MKIVQSYWSPATGGLGFGGGWLSAEYHWQSWALSVLQLRQFYDEVELVTDAAGKHILIDILQLPYTSVRVVFDEALAAYPHDLWALAKIYAYSIQTEPFLHIDGDVYIWKRFEPHIENAPLVAQNFEVDFPFYREPLHLVQDLTDQLQNVKSQYAANAGIIGGHQFFVFKKHKELAFELYETILSSCQHINWQSFNMFFEQFLYKITAKNEQIEITCLFENIQSDPLYPNLADFHLVPYSKTYIHALGNYKRQEVVVHHLAKRLRQDYPSYYYRILRACQSASLPLHSQVYNLPELSPSKHDDAYFSNLAHTYRSFTQTDIRYFYGKSMAAYKSVDALFGLPFEQTLLHTVVLCSDVKIVEETEPTLKQTLHFTNLLSLQTQERVLDNLDMILYDTCAEAQTIGQIIDGVGQYFPKEELASDLPKFQNLVLDRIRVGLYLGALEVC